MWSLQMVTAAGRRSLSHRQKHRNLQREFIFCPPNSLDLNPVDNDYAIWGALQQTVYHHPSFSVDEIESDCQSMAEFTQYRNLTAQSLINKSVDEWRRRRLDFGVRIMRQKWNILNKCSINM